MHAVLPRTPASLPADQASGNGLSRQRPRPGTALLGVLPRIRHFRYRRLWKTPASPEAQPVIGVNPLASTEALPSAAGRAGAVDQPVLILDGVAKVYDGRPVVAVPSWTVVTGRHSLILGPSGSGKSTLLHL